MKKLIVLFLSITMMLSLLSCDGGGSISSTSSSAAAEGAGYFVKQDPADLEWKANTTPVTLTAYYNGPSTKEWNWENDYLSKEITARTGITIDGTFAPDGTGHKLTLMMTSGQKLPDFIINIPTKSPYMQNLIKEGFLYSITDLMDQYAPKMRQVMLAGEEELNAWEDGKLYYLSTNAFSVSPADNEGQYFAMGHWAVRGDIMEEMGNPQPKDLDELVTLLKTVQSMHPEIDYPISLAGASMLGWLAYPFFLSYGGATSSADWNTFYDEKTDMVKFWSQDPKGKQALQFINRLFREGLLKKGQALDTEAYSEGRIFMNVGPNIYGMGDINQTLQKNGSSAYYRGMVPVAAKGCKYEMAGTLTADSGWGFSITKGSEHPDRAIQYAEFICSDEGQSLLHFGVNGVDYDIVENDGAKMPKYKGQFAELRKTDNTKFINQTGIGSYQMYMWKSNAVYELIELLGNGISSSAESIRAKTMYDAILTAGPYVTTNSKRTTSNANVLDSTSVEGKIYAEASMAMQSQVTQIMYAKTDEEFETLYTTLMNRLEQLGIDQWSKKAAEYCKKLIAICEKNGMVWSD